MKLITDFTDYEDPELSWLMHYACGSRSSNFNTLAESKVIILEGKTKRKSMFRTLIKLMR